MNIISLFSGAGGLDLGFKKVGFQIIWANEYDKDIWETFEKNFADTPWDEPSFTIQAGGRHAPLHPQAPKMELVAKDKRKFVEGSEDLYRRLSIRECARVQSFPDEHLFYYKNLSAGYKMVGNAVPPTLAYALATQIYEAIEKSRG